MGPVEGMREREYERIREYRMREREIVSNEKERRRESVE